MEPTPTKSSIAIPLAIVFGFGMVAFAVYFSDLGSKPAPVAAENNQPNQVATKPNIRPIDSSDYIKGNPNAPILIVEYSDYDCPFCKIFHQTMNQIMDEYGVTGKVAWVYRQLPISQLHPNSPRISEAALCVGSLGGSEAFWKFSNSIFEQRDVKETTNISRLPEYAESAGIKKADFQSCLQSGSMKEAVTKAYNEASSAGIQGTPQSFVLVGDQQAAIEGAQPYEAVKQIIENLLGQLEGKDPVPTPAPTETQI